MFLVDAFHDLEISKRMRWPTNAKRRLSGKLRRLASASGAFWIDGNLWQRLANLCVGLRWDTNTHFYIRSLGRAPNYVSPKALTDKVQWRKVFDHNPLFVTFTDKILARDYTRKIAPEVAIPRTFWIGEDPEEIPFDTFKEPYVIKPNHSSGQIIYVEDPATVDRQQVIETSRDWLQTQYGGPSAEWAYSRVRPRLIVEELLSGLDDGEKVTNYKFFVFSGQVRYTQFESKRPEGYFLSFFDADGNQLKIRKWMGLQSGSKTSTPAKGIQAPSKFAEMKAIAERIGKEIDMVRVDLYQVGDTIYFSELTLYDGSGYSWFYRDGDCFEGRPPQALNDEYGEFWELPRISPWQKILNCMVG